MLINVISHDNGVGLSKDYQILKEALPQHRLNFIDLKVNPKRTSADINIFLEIYDYKLTRMAGTNYFVPNPEWFMDKWHFNLKRIDKVICKTRDAERIFNHLGCDTVYTSFTSLDKNRPDIEKQIGFFHGAGKSMMKGTKYTKQVFEHTPEIPFFSSDAKTKFYSEEEFTKLQNQYQFHVCCSTYEGFGHYIHEAKSMGAIVLTTDGDPMREFITEETGILCRPVSQQRHGLAIMKICNARSIQDGVVKALGMSSDEIKQMSAKARHSWELNDVFFKKEINKLFP